MWFTSLLNCRLNMENGWLENIIFAGVLYKNDWLLLPGKTEWRIDVEALNTALISYKITFVTILLGLNLTGIIKNKNRLRKSNWQKCDGSDGKAEDSGLENPGFNLRVCGKTVSYQFSYFMPFIAANLSFWMDKNKIFNYCLKQWIILIVVSW